MKATFFSLASLALLAGSATASWCQYYYDAQCLQPSNGNTNFDCANSGVFGSGGQYVKCHQTVTRDDKVQVDRCADNNCNTVYNSITADPFNKVCQYTGGAGPWYREHCVPQ